MANKPYTEIGIGFYNYRCAFKVGFARVDIGSHMSLLQLSSGKFLVLDTIPLTEQLKQSIDLLTENGTKIEAILGTHPFHTLSFPEFFVAYGSTVPFYGTPRHLKKLPNIKWAGDTNDCNVRSKWEPEVQMRIPAGSEFKAPEDNNHFSCVFVFHAASRTLHVDDTIMYSISPGFLLRLGGYKADSMCFHPTIKSTAFYPTSDAPFMFKDFVRSVLTDWDFDNICTAHFVAKTGGAKKQLEEILVAAEPLFKRISDENAKKTPQQTVKEEIEITELNVSGSECG